MANLNVSNRMVQVLGNQQAQTLVNKILNDGKVDKTDKEDLKALEAMLKSAAEEDGTLDGEEKELIGALTNHSYVLGVNTGTSEEILLDNLKKVQQIQNNFKDMQPSEVAFDGLAITTDGFFSDEVRVVRLRDQVEAPAPQNSEPQQNTGTQTTSPADPATTPTASNPTVEEGTTPPSGTTTPEDAAPTPIPPQTQYNPTTAPQAGSPAVNVPPEQASQVAPQQQAYTEAVQNLQNEVQVVRDMLNDPSQISNEQLQTSLQSFAESDPTRALSDLKRHNSDILKDMKAAGLLSDTDIINLESASSLTNHRLSNGSKFGDTLAQYLKDTPLSDTQLNGYRQTLVQAADNYIADPSDANRANLRGELYDNLYVFEKGVSPAQEDAYRKLSPALDHVDQTRTAFDQQLSIATGQSSALRPDITTTSALAENLGSLSSVSQSQIDTFAGHMDNVVKYLEENPEQYAGQGEDAAALSNKVNELKSTSDPQRRLAILNELKTDLDEIYIKTDIQKGAEGVSETETLRKLAELKTVTTDESVRQTADFLIQNPELLTNLPNVSEYKNILDSLNNSQQPLSTNQQALKAALESGDSSKVNQLYMNEMFNNMGSFFSGFGGMFGLGSATTAVQEPPLPGTWLGASELAETLQSATPERRAELIAALQSPEAGQLAQTLQNSPELSQIMGRYTNAQNAKSSIEQAQWSSNSVLEQAQQAIQNEQNQAPNIQLELSNASASIEKALASGDLAPTVKAKLTAQKAAIDKALTLIEQGKFDEAAAQSPDMAALNGVLSAIATNDKTPPMDIGLVLQREASIQALSEAATPANMQKLEAALKDNPNYTHIFAKDAEGNYQFPGELSKLLQSDDLSPEALALLLNQSNRAIEVMDSATTRDVNNLRANYDKGKELETQDGVQRDFYSGYMALESLNTIAQTSQNRSNLSQSDILNNIAEQQDVSAILSNSDRGERRSALTEAMRSENIEKGTTEARQERLTDYIAQAQEFEKTKSGMLLNSIFSNPDSEGRSLINEQLAKITPPVDSSQINSKEDLFRLLSADQIQQLQDNIAQAPYSPARQELETTRNELLSAIPKMQPPLDPPYEEGRTYDTSNMSPTDSRKRVLDELNALNQKFKEVGSTERDLIKDIFAQTQTQDLFRAGQALNDVSQDLRTDMGRSLDLLDQEIAATSPAAQEYLRNSNLPPRPQLTAGGNQADYEREVSQYIQAVQQQLSNYQSIAPQEEQAALDRISQRATQISTLSEASSTINSGRVSSLGSEDISRYTSAQNVVTTTFDNAVEANIQAENFIENTENRQAIDRVVPGGSAQIEDLLRGPITQEQVTQFETDFAALRVQNPELYQNILLRVQNKAFADSNVAEVSDAVHGRSDPGAGNRMAFGQIVSTGSSAVTDMQPRPTSQALFAWNQLVRQYGPSAQNGTLDSQAFLNAVSQFQQQYGITSPALTQAVSNFPANSSQLETFSTTVSDMPPHERSGLQGLVADGMQGVMATRAAIGAQVNGADALRMTQEGSPPADPDFQANLQEVTQEYSEVSTAELFGGAMASTSAVNENLGLVYEEAERTGDFSLADRMRAATSQSYQDILGNYDETFEALSGTTGIPYTPVSNEHRAASGLSVGAVQGSTAADQRAAELVDKANALADRLILAPEGENSEEFLMELINGFIDTIRDQDYKTRQLILAQLANQMMTDSITNFYKDKTDKNNKYHQDSISRMAESFQRNIQRTIQESLVSQASDGQSIAAVSGQVGAANTAEAMGLEQLRASSEQLLSEAQKMTPPLITDLQKEKILESLFDNNPNNDALGIIALAGLRVN